MTTTSVGTKLIFAESFSEKTDEYLLLDVSPERLREMGDLTIISDDRGQAFLVGNASTWALKTLDSSNATFLLEAPPPSEPLKHSYELCAAFRSSLFILPARPNFSRLFAALAEVLYPTSRFDAVQGYGSPPLRFAAVAMDSLLSFAAASEAETLFFLWRVRAVPVRDTVPSSLGTLRPRFLRRHLENRVVSAAIARFSRDLDLGATAQHVAELEEMPVTAVLALLLCYMDTEQASALHATLMRGGEPVLAGLPAHFSLLKVAAGIAAQLVSETPSSPDRAVEQILGDVETLCSGSSPDEVFGEPLVLDIGQLLRSGRLYLTESGQLAYIESAALSWDPVERLASLFRLKPEWPTGELLPLMADTLPGTSATAALEEFLVQNARNAGLVDGRERWVSKYY